MLCNDLSARSVRADFVGIAPPGRAHDLDGVFAVGRQIVAAVVEHSGHVSMGLLPGFPPKTCGHQRFMHTSPEFSELQLGCGQRRISNPGLFYSAPAPRGLG